MSTLHSCYLTNITDTQPLVGSANKKIKMFKTVIGDPISVT